MGELVSHGRCIVQLNALPHTLPYYLGGPRAELSEQPAVIDRDALTVSSRCRNRWHTLQETVPLCLACPWLASLSSGIR